MTTKAVAEAYEERLWEELNLLLADARESATDEEAQQSILLAVTGHHADSADLYWQVRRLACTERGFLRERLEEDNPVAAVGRRLAGQQA